MLIDEITLSELTETVQYKTTVTAMPTERATELSTDLSTERKTDIRTETSTPETVSDSSLKGTTGRISKQVYNHSNAYENNTA